jgi:aspartyl-tRNA synthetase
MLTIVTGIAHKIFKNSNNMLSSLSTNFAKINLSLVGQTITVGGFVHTIRDHGGLIFIDLRSQSDLVQCVFDPAKNPKVFEIAEGVHSEYVLKITGTVIARDPEMINPNLPSGEIEIVGSELEIVSKAKPMPFDIHAETGNLAGEETRLKYRYLDLRRGKLKAMMTKKHKLTMAVRQWFDANDFIEVMTPILANPSPEGARDFVVPSRLHPGKFYALPQAPQQFKQLLMIGGFNKYFQIAPCFRDEDPRADRHPGDFYQIDAEIAWAEQEDIFAMNEKFACETLEKFTDLVIPSDDKANGFVKIRYDDAMARYGSDKPDLRYDLPWADAKPVFAGSDFKVFADLCDNPEYKVQALVIKGGNDKFSRSDLDKVQDIGRQYGLPGIAYIQYTPEGEKSPIFKFFGDETVQETKKAQIKAHFGLETNDLLLFIANKDKNIVFKAQNQMRQHIAKHLDKIDGSFINKSILKFAWVYDFPFFEIEDGKIDFAHNPFGVWYNPEGKTKMEVLMEAKNSDSLDTLRAVQYDLTLNGYEILSGGVRNSNSDTLMEAFKTVGYTEAEIMIKFKHMMEAYQYGAPNHAGFAWGIDRLFMILTGEDNIREVIAFPKNGQGMDTMTNSPSAIQTKSLRELNIKLSL